MASRRSILEDAHGPGVVAAANSENFRSRNSLEQACHSPRDGERVAGIEFQAVAGVVAPENPTAMNQQYLDAVALMQWCSCPRIERQVPQREVVRSGNRGGSKSVSGPPRTDDSRFAHARYCQWRGAIGLKRRMPLRAEKREERGERRERRRGASRASF